MQIKQFENENFILYAPNSLNHITKDLESMLNNSFELYKKIFDVVNFRKVQINYFDNIEEFRKFIYGLRGNNLKLPEYCKGTFDKGMINAYIDPTIPVGSELYVKKRYVACHELFHIMYKELIINKENIERIVWFDEGMAQLFCGKYDNIDFDSFTRETIASTKVIPNLNDLTHGSQFETVEYSGYKLCLIAVRTIYDSLGFDKFKKILKDTNKIREYGKNILNEIFENSKK